MAGTSTSLMDDPPCSVCDERGWMFGFTCKYCYEIFPICYQCASQRAALASLTPNITPIEYCKQCTLEELILPLPIL